MTDEVQTTIEETVTEARKEFSLKDRLMNRPQRVSEKTVYTDEVLGEKHQVLTVALEAAKLVSDDSEQSKTEIEEIETQIKEVAREIDKTALTFHFRAVPEVIVKDIRRKTKKTLGIKGPIPVERTEEFSEAFTATLLSKAVEKFKDHESDEFITSLSYEQARDLADYLPAFEYKKLDDALGDLQFRNTISEAVTQDADF